MNILNIRKIMKTSNKLLLGLLVVIILVMTTLVILGRVMV